MRSFNDLESGPRFTRTLIILVLASGMVGMAAGNGVRTLRGADIVPVLIVAAVAWAAGMIFARSFRPSLARGVARLRNTGKGHPNGRLNPGRKDGSQAEEGLH
jgi:hypothetical protein